MLVLRVHKVRRALREQLVLRGQQDHKVLKVM